MDFKFKIIIIMVCLATVSVFLEETAICLEYECIEVTGLMFEYSTRSIEGPDSAVVGNDITLQCAVIEGQHFPYDKYWHWIAWDTPNSGNKPMAVLQKFNLRKSILLINTITIKRTSIGNQGVYKCKLNKQEILAKYVYINDGKTNHSAPRIYSPSGDEIQINSGDNITLRCTGSRPVTWKIFRPVHRFYIEHLSKNESNEYESYLHISDAEYRDTGFYYCYENNSDMKVHPLMSTKFYVFVNDEQNLYTTQFQESTAYPYSNITVPCLPTSRDVNVSLSMMHEFRDRIKGSTGREEKIINPVVYSYDPRKGFSIQIPDLGDGFIIATCTFVTKTAKDTYEKIYSIVGSDNMEPFIIGPSEDFVFVGQTLELSCIVFVYNNIPDDALRWAPPNNSNANEIIPEIKRINFQGGKVLINKMKLDNVEVTDSGRYTCSLNSATVDKVISVYDKFDLEPIIHNLQYDFAYIGQPFSILCKVIADHNVDFQIYWTTNNDTQIQGKIMNTEYVTNVRNIHGHKVLRIDNVTYHDGGNYSCFVSDFTNRRNYATKNILIKRGVKPRIVRSNFNKVDEMDVLLEATVNLTCSAEGDPKPAITWMKGSSEVRRLDKHIDISSNNSELTIHFVQMIDAGLYTCIAQSSLGRDFRAVNLRVVTVQINGWYIALLICVIMLTTGTVGLLIRKIWKRKKSREDLIYFKNGGIDNLNPFLNITEQASLLPYDVKWEIPRYKIELGRNLGSGCFGLVVKATVSNFFDEEPEKTVAVKMLPPYSNFMDLNSLICELKIMTYIGKHDNLINLLGACTENIGEKSLLVVIEYCKNGNLRNYLVENRCNFVNLIDPDTELISFPHANYIESLDVISLSDKSAQLPVVSTLHLLHWALQVARGMEFLASRKILHGDLATRNILLDDYYVAKISDFGLSKTLNSNGYYKKKSHGPLPIKWMALESIRDKTFSTKSDVWAFGVVLWELFTLARIPYAELEPDFCFYRKLESGYRLGQPEYSTREIYQVMRECWCAQPQCRPTFPSLVRTLTDLIQEPITRCSETNYHNNESASSKNLFPNITEEPVTTAEPAWIELDIFTTTEISNHNSSVKHDYANLNPFI